MRRNGANNALFIAGFSTLGYGSCEADPVDEILKQSLQLDCDLIVMGTHRKGIAYTFLGSVSKRVMSNTRLPVLVIPMPAD